MVRVSSSHSYMVSFSPWRFSFVNLTKCVISVGSDAFCQDGAFVSVSDRVFGIFVLWWFLRVSSFLLLLVLVGSGWVQ